MVNENKIVITLPLLAVFLFSSLSNDKEYISDRLCNHVSISKKLAYEEFKGECTAYGFEISNEWIPYGTDEFYESSYPSYDNGILQYQTDIQQIFLKCKDASGIFAFAYRIVQSPVQPGRHVGFLGIGSYGDNWYARGVKTTIDLRSGYKLTDWAPENSPSKRSETIGVSGGTSGFSISASVSFDHDELEVTSRTNVAKRHYETEYSVSGTDKYAKYSLKFYGFLTFMTNDSIAYIDVKHESKFQGIEYHGNITESYAFTF